MSDQLIFNIPRLTPKEFEKFSKLIYDESGIFLKENKLTLLSNRLRKRLKELNLSDYASYYDYINKSINKEEVHSLLDVVSTNETYFFRNEKHFEAFRLVLEMISTKKEKSGNNPLRIWSAGCSTGEEPYTMALLIYENRHLLGGRQIEIIATDISTSVLEFARLGCYSGRRIDRVSRQLLQKYFSLNKQKEEHCINKELKNIVKFDILNLFKDPYPKDLDIIFCRNVMIYFDRIHQKKLVEGFAKVLKPDGHLFIGHAETLYNISNQFTYSKIGEAPVYIKVDG